MMDWVWQIGAMLLAAVAALIALRFAYRRLRRRALIRRYGSDDVADGIMAKRIWQGMTAEQLREAWGKPDDIDTKVTKTKETQTWKYGPIRGNQFRERVTLEDGIVTGWTLK